jgi:hypothetical protein
MDVRELSIDEIDQVEGAMAQWVGRAVFTGLVIVGVGTGVALVAGIAVGVAIVAYDHYND